jgi:hypothetical protein
MNASQIRTQSSRIVLKWNTLPAGRRKARNKEGSRRTGQGFTPGKIPALHSRMSLGQPRRSLTHWNYCLGAKYPLRARTW